MKKARDWKTPPSEDIARVSLKLLLDEDADEPQYLIDQARAWLKENFAQPSAVKETAE